MVEVLKNIRSIDFSEEKDESLKSWMLECDKGVVIIDTGLKQDLMLNSIASELHSIAKKWDDVKLILITHKHGDHIGNLAEIKRLTGAPVKSHRLEAPQIEKATKVKVEKLDHGQVLDYCGGIEVVHVPGHTEGNCCYYLRKSKVMIGGDTVFGDEKGNLTPPPEEYCLDAKQAAREIKRLLNYHFECLLYAHGKDVLEDAKSRVRELVKRTS